MSSEFFKNMIETEHQVVLIKTLKEINRYKPWKSYESFAHNRTKAALISENGLSEDEIKTCQSPFFNQAAFNIKIHMIP